MENTIKVSCSAVTHIGSDRIVNENRVYVNGKFLQSHRIENSQISFESDGNLFIFALSDGMEMDSDSRISINDELKKFHKKTLSSSKDIQVKLDEMAESVQQTSNLLYSISLGKDDEETRNSSFSGILIKDGSLAAISLGNSRVYKLEADYLKPLINDSKRADRLLKMGIINDEQAELIAGQSKSSGLDDSLKVRKSDIYRVKEGNEYLLCSASLMDALGEEGAFEILDKTRETDSAAAELIKEAVEKGCEDNVTAMVIRIEEVMEGEEEEAAAVKNTAPRRVHVHSSPARYSRMARKKSIDIAGIASTFVIVAIIAAVTFGLFSFWMSIRKPNKEKDTLAQNTSAPTASGTSTSDGIIPDETDDVDETESSTIVEPTENEDKTAGEGTTYIVKAGDSLMKISKEMYGHESKYTLIMEANNITNPDKIQVGQVLKIPPLE